MKCVWDAHPDGYVSASYTNPAVDAYLLYN